MKILLVQSLLVKNMPIGIHATNHTSTRTIPIAQRGLALCRDIGHMVKLLALGIDAACERLFMPPGTVNKAPSSFPSGESAPKSLPRM